MPPAPHEYHGIPAITDFFRTSMTFRGLRRLSLVPTRANTQPAFGAYLAENEGTAAGPAGLIVLTLTGDRIGAITRFHTNHLLPRFGLPESVR
jgi:RNA polymerase sigma-70 factor (ECF subfamily)